jgi:hypothetical protein
MGPMDHVGARGRVLTGLEANEGVRSDNPQAAKVTSSHSRFGEEFTYVQLNDEHKQHTVVDDNGQRHDENIIRAPLSVAKKSICHVINYAVLL